MTEIKTTRFQRKPFFVDAVQVTAENIETLTTWCKGELRHTRAIPEENVVSAPYIKVGVLNPKNERQTRAYVGDWLLRVDNNFKVYSSKSFNLNFVMAPLRTGNDHQYGQYLDQNNINA